MEGPPLLHVDADAFFAGVELRDEPALEGVPFAVADVVVMCAGYVARGFGVRAGIPTAHALRIHPGLVVVPPRPEAYREASRDVFAVLEDVARTVEPGSMEEAFLDVEGLEWGTAGAAGEALRRRVLGDVGLSVSVGAGRTKLVAKLASRAAKPGGVRVVHPAEEAVLRPRLRLADLWGVGPRTLERLDAAGLATVADLAARTPEELRAVAGTAMGKRLHAIATGTDDATVRRPGPRQSASASTTARVTSLRQAQDVVRTLAGRLATRLGEENLGCRHLALATGRGDRLAAVTLGEPLSAGGPLTEAALALLAEAAPRATLPGLTLTATRLVRPGE